MVCSLALRGQRDLADRSVNDLCERLNYSRSVQELTTTQELLGREPLAEQSGVLSERAAWRGLSVFVKTLLSDDQDAQARFDHEGKVAASLAHPQIVPLLARTPTQLIFPYLEGGTLRETLERGPLSVDQATDVTAGVLSAVAYMHSIGVTHHDLKPENVLLLGSQPQADAIRVVDFGMSHSTRLVLDIHSGTRMGTPHFMAPEQYLGKRGDPRSDLYSVGVLLYDCLAGQPPFQDAFGWLMGLHDAPLDLPGPPPLHALLRSSLSRDPHSRPASAVQMLSELQRARAALGLPLVAPDLNGLPRLE